jgi:hypothetical protein
MPDRSLVPLERIERAILTLRGRQPRIRRPPSGGVD